ncbi:BHLH domain-containing protein [Psidium guajava]|nr:BHLH domain-containing protein [Psidium guajava]
MPKVTGEKLELGPNLKVARTIILSGEGEGERERYAAD